jgi:DNA-binding LacI/PurR family transcriptional regulator
MDRWDVVNMTTEHATLPTRSKTPTRRPGTARRNEAQRVMDALEQLCATHPHGERIPTHTELMRRLGASERTVLNALGELQRRGRIVRRHGSGTFVSHETPGTAPSASTPTPTATRSFAVIARPDQSFFDRCIELLYEHAKAEDVDLVFRFLPPGRDIDSVPVVEGATGVIVFKYEFAPLARRFADAGVRVVVVGTPPADELPDVPTVYGDQEHGGYIATKYVIALGHRRIMFAHVGPGHTRLARWTGIQRAIAEARTAGLDITLTAEDIAERPEWLSSAQSARDMVRRADAPTAIIVWNDHEAVRILKHLSTAGIDIPGEITIVGYDALPEGEMVQPSLTTVDSAIHQQLDSAVRILTRPTAPPRSQTVIALPTLIVRDSSAAPKVIAPELPPH